MCHRQQSLRSSLSVLENCNKASGSARTFHILCVRKTNVTANTIKKKKTEPED